LYRARCAAVASCALLGDLRVGRSCTVAERLRTRIIERNLQMPPLFVDLDETEERRRRAGVTRRRKNGALANAGMVPRKRLDA